MKHNRYFHKKHLSIGIVSVLVFLCTAAMVHVKAVACDLNATTANFASQVSAATAGQTVCLATGNYGTWTGVNKAIIVRAAAGASPTMTVNFGSTASGFTLDGMKGMGGLVTAAKNVTIKNSDFSSSIDFEGNNVNFVLDGNTLDWNARSGGINSKIFFDTANNGTLAAPSLTIKNNHIANGELDGVHTGGNGLLILNNIFDNLCDVGLNHTDNIQFEGGAQTRIAGNYIHENADCPTQGITSFDSGTNGVIIENNVVDIHRPWAIELYSDKNSIVRHNTLVWHPDADCDFNNLECGEIDITHKSEDPPGSGTQIYDNITASVNVYNGSTAARVDHNLVRRDAATGDITGSPVFVGGSSPTSFASFALAAGSAGKGAASDGTDIGITVSGGGSTGGTYHLSDLSTLIAHYGVASGMTTATGDINGDGAVNMYDLSIMLSDYSP